MTDLKDLIKNNNIENIHCGGCGNSLIHCGKYVIIDAIEKEDPEGVLCETCQKNGRKLKGTIIKKKVEAKENIREKFKNIQPERTKFIGKPSNMNTNTNKKENVEKEKEKKI